MMCTPLKGGAAIALLLICLSYGCSAAEDKTTVRARGCDVEGEVRGELVCRGGEWTRQRPSADQGMWDMGARPDMPPPCQIPAVLAAHSDERTTPGTTYKASPQLMAGDVIRWRKSYGPDAVSVNPDTGELTWELPAGMPGESFHIGVRAEDACGGYVEDVWVLTVGDGTVVRMGKGQTYALIHEAMQAAGSGGTIIIEPGVYEPDGFKNSLNSSSDARPLPPAGTPDAFTTLIASAPGESIFTSSIFLDSKFGAVEYIAIKGLYTRAGIGLTRSSEQDPRPHHIKITEVGVEGGINFSHSDDVLVEGCYVFGGSRYKLSAYKSSRVIFRRCIIRHDHEPIEGQFSPYGGAIAYSSDDIIFQNVLDIDSDQRELYPINGEATGSFAVPTTAGPSKRIVYQRCMSINNALKWGSYDNTNGTAEVTYDNVIGWDIDTVTGLPDLSHGFGDGLYDHATFGDITSAADVSASVRGYFNGWSGEDEIRNSFFSNIDQPLFYNIEGLSYNAFHSAPKHEATGPNHRPETFVEVPKRDAVLRHLPRIEPGSALAGAGSDGADIGARVMTFVGSSGTFYGEPGWDQETSISMWPFPHEEQISAAMRAYRYEGPIADGRMISSNGDRGFAQKGVALDGGPRTLTSYIWEYLGHPCPAEICRP